MSTCSCNITESVLGDGCRYCQPQEAIDMCIYQLDASKREVRQLEQQLAESRKNDRIGMSWLSDMVSAVDSRMTFQELLDWIKDRVAEKNGGMG